MRIGRIDVEGDARGRTVELMRDGANVTAVVRIDGKVDHTHVVGASQTENLFEMATRIQHALDGCRGTNSMIHDYYRLIQRLAD